MFKHFVINILKYIGFLNFFCKRGEILWYVLFLTRKIYYSVVYSRRRLLSVSAESELKFCFDRVWKQEVSRTLENRRKSHSEIKDRLGGVCGEFPFDGDRQ